MSKLRNRRVRKRESFGNVMDANERRKGKEPVKIQKTFPPVRNRRTRRSPPDMYAKCGALAKAQQVFDELSVRDVVSWNALIAGYAQQGQGEEALNCFRRMQSQGLSPDAVSILKCRKLETANFVLELPFPA